jgi:hypothetical protein
MTTMTPISFRAADGLALDVTLQRTTFTSLLGVIRIASPALADKVQDAARDGATHVVNLGEDEVEFLSAAANTRRKSERIDDTELDRIAEVL